MSPDVRGALRAAAATDTSSPDLEAAWHRARALRRRRMSRYAAVGTLCVALVVSGAVVALDSRDSRVTVNPAKATSYSDPTQGFSVDIPSGWHRAETVLVQNPGPSEFELLSVGTFRLPSADTGTTCASQLPTGAIDTLGARDAFVYVVEGFSNRGPTGVVSPAPVSDFRDRPVRFETTPMRTDECVGPTGPVHQSHTFRHLYFQDHDRVIGVYITWGSDVSPRRKAETWQLLDSLAFESQAAGPRSRTYRDEFNGFTVTLPGDWEQTPSYPFGLLDVLAPELVEIGCGAGTNAAQISVSEIVAAPGSDAPKDSRPSQFGPSTGSTQPSGTSTVNGCAVDEPGAQTFAFTDAGRRFQVFVHLRPEATAERRQQTYEILNSLRFDPLSELHRGRPAAEVRVFVLDGRGHRGAVEAAQNQLSGFGYVFTGSRRRSKVTRTSVTCLSPFADDIETLARVIGNDTVREAPPEDAPKRINGADCIVTLGQNAGFTTTNAPQEVRVMIRNASGDDGAADMVANTLRGLGYQVLPATTANKRRDGTVVSCRHKFALEANNLLAVIGADAPSEYRVGRTRDFSELAGEDADFDCIVIIGD